MMLIALNILLDQIALAGVVKAGAIKANGISKANSTGVITVNFCFPETIGYFNELIGFASGYLALLAPNGPGPGSRGPPAPPGSGSGSGRPPPPRGSGSGSGHPPPPRGSGSGSG